MKPDEPFEDVPQQSPGRVILGMLLLFGFIISGFVFAAADVTPRVRIVAFLACGFALLQIVPLMMKSFKAIREARLSAESEKAVDPTDSLGK